MAAYEYFYGEGYEDEFIDDIPFYDDPMDGQFVRNIFKKSYNECLARYPDGIEVRVCNETSLAYLFDIGYVQPLWFPKSQVKEYGHNLYLFSDFIWGIKEMDKIMSSTGKVKLAEMFGNV